MWFRSLLDSLSRSPRRRKQSAIDRQQQARRLLLEGLEDRRLLALVPAANYAVGGAPQSIISADFNNDGRLDLATANSSSSNVSVLLGNADGSFQPALNSPTGAGPRSVAVGDFDGDGNLDLATANAYDVSILKGDGLGGFAAPANSGIWSSPSSVAVGDFNGDGKMDLGVTGNYYFPGGCWYGCYPGYYQGSVNVLLGIGAGTFSAPIANFLGTSEYPFSGAASADFNGDGKDDFAAVDSYWPSAAVLFGSSTGTLSYPSTFYVGYLPTSLIATDANGDSKADIVTANTDSGSVSVLVGNGLGSFAAAQNYAAGANPSAVAVGDFNGDLRPDLIASNEGDNTVSVLLGTPSGTFKPPVNVATGAGPVGVAVGDFNGDGRADAASANYTASQVSVLLNNATWPALDAPVITIADAGAVTEGNTGTVNANFTVSLSAQANQPLSVLVTTAGGSATDGSDYQTLSQTLTFNPGETSKVISIPVIGDRVGEFSETFFVKLSDPVNAFVADATGLGTILDDEPFVSIDGDFSDVEGHAGTKVFTFTVSLSNEYDMPVTVDYATADLIPGGHATAGVDYTAKSGTVTFAAHQTTSETITVLVNGDRVGEWDELFFVNLSNPSGARLGASQAVGTIVNDEPYVWIDSSLSIPEGNSGQAALTFTLRLSAEYDEPVTVTYDTIDGNAVAGSDFVGITGGTATIAAHTTSQTFSVLINGDTLTELDEYFSVNITNVSGARISSGWANGYILDDDTPPTIYIDDAYMTEGNSGTTSMTFTVSLSNPSGQAVSVNYATANSTAKTSDNDYTAASGRLDFAPGETTKTITVTVRGDTRKEANERFLVKLSGAVGATIADSQGEGTIANDDGGGKGRGKGSRSDSFALAVDAAFDDWMAFGRKKRGR